ncbi:MAG TPA: ABC transporter permease [Candidatus Merdisoma merdipullorum]|nr:ABC transporter permease [Candidatus Merdisoma merdipullorum]
MNGLRAALKKDMRLFMSGSGFAAFLLPALLFLVLCVSEGELLRPPYIEAFAVGIRDEDNTPMSRSLIQQIEEVELFSEVIRLEPGESDEHCLNRGCAAVVTIPKDFFYTMYYMENGKVSVLLNEETPLESALFQSVFTSVMNIIAADQTSAKAVYEFCYGELSADQEKRLWEETSNQLILDALGRQGVFANSMETEEAQQDVQRGLLVCALSVLCIFFSLTAVKTLPEEFSLGILPRYMAAGGSLWAFVLSKFCVAILSAAPSVILLLLIFQPQNPGIFYILSVIYFAEAFGCLLLLSAFFREAAAIQRAGNLLLLLWLIMGGALYAREFFPVSVQNAAVFTLPYYIRQGLEMLDMGRTYPEILFRMFPSLTASVAMGCLGVFLLPHGSLKKKAASAGEKENLSESLAIKSNDKEQRRTRQRKSFIQKTGKLALFKLTAMAGGRKGLVALTVVVSFCGLLASYVLKGEGATSLRLYVAMEEESSLTIQLTQYIEDYPGITLISGSEREGRRCLESGRAEGMLVIGASYEKALYGQEQLPLYYESRSSAVSEQAAREIIAGQVILQKARVRGFQNAEQILGRSLSAIEREELLRGMETQWEELPPLYEIRTMQGETARTVQNSLAPNQMGFAALAVLLTLLTWGVWTGRRDARRIEQRMKVVLGGAFLSYCSDILALWAAGMLAGLCALLPAGEGEPESIAILAVYTFCTAGAALALARHTVLNGRMDAFAPFIALATCMAGGCFGDLSRFSPLMEKISFFTPQGLALRAAGGQGTALVYLFLMGTTLLLIGAPGRKNKNNK